MAEGNSDSGSSNETNTYSLDSLTSGTYAGESPTDTYNFGLNSAYGLTEGTSSEGDPEIRIPGYNLSTLALMNGGLGDKFGYDDWREKLVGNMMVEYMKIIQSSILLGAYSAMLSEGNYASEPNTVDYIRNPKKTEDTEAHRPLLKVIEPDVDKKDDNYKLAA